MSGIQDKNSPEKRSLPLTIETGIHLIYLQVYCYEKPPIKMKVGSLKYPQPETVHLNFDAYINYMHRSVRLNLKVGARVYLFAPPPPEIMNVSYTTEIVVFKGLYVGLYNIYLYVYIII